LEKNFPMVGKNWPIFPMIGKIFRPFSNDWKKFSRQRSGRDSSRKGDKEHKGGGKRDNLDNIGQLLQGAPPQPGGG
jgi:hypothetical protein